MTTVTGMITTAAHPASPRERADETRVEIRFKRDDKQPDIVQHVPMSLMPAFDRTRDFCAERYELTLDNEGTIVGVSWLPQP